jgi:hypothetical protein
VAEAAPSRPSPAAETPSDTPRLYGPGAPLNGARETASVALPVPQALSGSSAPPDRPPASAPATTSDSVSALVSRARRQIDDRHLTTPIGDNALETVRAMESAAAAGIEPTRLRAAIVDSYLRLGALAEQRGQYPLARVYYRRAQQAVPGHQLISARLSAVETRMEKDREEAPPLRSAPSSITIQTPVISDTPRLR